MTQEKEWRFIMTKRILLTALITLISFAGIAHADIFAAGPVYGSFAELSGGQITCRVFNAGLTPVTINLTQIWTNTGVLVTLASNTCLGSLNSIQSCAFSAPITGNLAYSCRVNAQGTDTNITGVAEIQAGGNILNALPLQR
jgi:hypothetical protein